VAGVVNMGRVTGFVARVFDISSMHSMIHCLVFKHLIIWGVCPVVASGRDMIGVSMVVMSLLHFCPLFKRVGLTGSRRIVFLNGTFFHKIPL
jgi:hypothetical protein